MKKNIFHLILILILCGVSNVVMAGNIDVILKCNNGLTLKCSFIDREKNILKVEEGDYAAKGKKELVIPYEVDQNGAKYYIEEIGENSFWRLWGGISVGYDTIIFSEGIKVIGEKAFRGHKGVREIVFPQSLQKICRGAFFMTGRTLEKINVPDNVELEKHAFGSTNEGYFSKLIINLPNYVTPDNMRDYGIKSKSFKAYYESKQKQLAAGTYVPTPTGAPVTVESAIISQVTKAPSAYERTRENALNASSAQASATPSTSLTSSTTTGNEVALVEASSNTSNRFFSDVDINIPSSAQDNENTFVVIFANENYQSEVKVDYAINDGEMFQTYCYNVLGVPSENIHIAEDATLNNMIAEFDWIQKISKAYNGDAKFLVYYAGHGIPDEATGQSYLLPVDGKGSILRTAFSLKEFYQTLGSLEAKNVTVFMDACFSGSKRGDGMLAAARGVAIKAKNEAPKGNLVVFSAAQGDETAYPYNDKQHGLFTYYLLKKLQDTKGNVTLGELSDYISTQVSRKSIVSNGKSQTPSTLTSTTLADSWKTIKLK